MNRVHFETPENIEVSYQPAGTGTRFVAWFIDNILLTIGFFLLFFLMACLGAASDSVLRELFEPLSEMDGPEDFQQLQLVFIGLWMLVWGLGSFFYFGLSELFLRGQTIGKRSAKVRVVKSDGFSLDPISIFLRNIFRVLDQIPPLWIVPVLSARHQRFGDMVAGTIVIADELHEISGVREELGGRGAAESRFRFDAGMLNRARPSDFDAVERILERWGDLGPNDRRELAARMVPALAERLQSEQPAPDEYRRYLEDLLAAEYRRQNRNLG